MKIRNLLMLLSLGLFFMACDRYNELKSSDPLSEEVNIEEELYLTALFDELDEEINSMDGSIGDNGIVLKSGGLRSQYKVYINPGTKDKPWPKIIMIDWGDENVEDENGILHRGKIIIKRWNPDTKKGLARVITYDEYYRNNNKIEGYKKWFKKADKDDNLLWALHDSIHVTRTNLKEYTRVSKRLKAQIEGLETKERSDNVFMITGGSKVLLDNGLKYSRVIMSPLIKRADCPSYVQGEIHIVKDKEVKRVILYGDGECDNEVTVIKGDDVEQYIVDYIKDKKGSEDKGEKDEDLADNI